MQHRVPVIRRTWTGLFAAGLLATGLSACSVNLDSGGSASPAATRQASNPMTAPGNEAAPSAIASSTPATGRRRVPSSQVAVGDCIQDLGDAASNGNVDQVPVVDCRSPHIAQVTARFTVDADSWPGKEDLMATGSERCPTLTARVTAADAPALTDMVLSIDEREWSEGHRTISCLVRGKSSQLLNRSVLA